MTCICNDGTLFGFILQASKAALTCFFESLRTELGSEIGITIVSPGVIESEMTGSRQFVSQVITMFRVQSWFG